MGDNWSYTDGRSFYTSIKGAFVWAEARSYVSTEEDTA